MSAETQLYAALSAAGSVSSIVGTRIYPDVVPQEQPLPAIAYVRTETEFLRTIHGDVLGETAQIEIWCMAENRMDAESLAEAVEAACVSTGFMPTGRRAELDAETQTWATVLAVEFFSN